MHFYVTQLYLVPHSRKKSFLFFSFLLGGRHCLLFLLGKTRLNIPQTSLFVFYWRKFFYKVLEMRVSKFDIFMHLADAFIQSDFQLHSGYTFLINMCFPWESNPQPFALLTQCSTTEPQRNTNDDRIFILGWIIPLNVSTLSLLLFLDVVLSYII